ncbi:MAG: hypothetical protein KDM91_11130 [Verrucomicrobiae bacterium]|nr:hypothetical protein [Verrucomicrobiae bacterium]MCP5541720.1 hypothetical protein [Akkermansiaceae bacterium]MCP5551753.1 hypothetical protein [Akkermansiaceae bacterium]
MAIRYDQKKKDEVVAFILDYNKANGRGGQTVAAKKYGISPITIGAWLKKAGVKKAGGRGKAKAAATPKGPGRGRGRGRRAAAVSGATSDVLSRMMEVSKQIEALQAEYASLKARL